jgi:hypothetical protein
LTRPWFVLSPRPWRYRYFRLDTPQFMIIALNLGDIELLSPWHAAIWLSLATWWYRYLISLDTRRNLIIALTWVISIVIIALTRPQFMIIASACAIDIIIACWHTPDLWLSPWTTVISI